MPRVTKADRDAAIARLREWLKPGDEVYTSLLNVSASGMSRTLGVHAFIPEPSRGPRAVNHLWLSRSVAMALGWGWDEKREGVRVGGCGMDMGFHLVYELSAVLGIELTQRWV